MASVIFLFNESYTLTDTIGARAKPL